MYTSTASTAFRMNQLYLNTTGIRNGSNNIRSSYTDLPHGQMSMNFVSYQDEKFRIPHTFQVHTYGIPTVCQYCKKLLKGLFKQGVQCRDCQYNAHKKCLDKVPQDCTGERQLYIQNDSIHHTANMTSTTSNITKEQHRDNDHFFREEFDDSDLDDTCSTLPDEKLLQPQQNANSNQIMANHDNTTNFNLKNELLNLHPQQIEDDKYKISDCLNGVIVNNESNTNEHKESSDELADSSRSFDRSTDRSISVCPQTSNNIPLMRIVQSVKHTKRRQGQSFKEGWLVHYTNFDKIVKRYYWRLDAKTITLFVSEEGSKYHKEIQLADIQCIEINTNPSLSRNYYFELRTNDVIYYIGQDPLVGVKEEHAVRLPPPESGIGSDIAKSWETSIKQAFMHVSNTRKLKYSHKIYSIILLPAKYIHFL